MRPCFLTVSAEVLLGTLVVTDKRGATDSQTQTIPGPEAHSPVITSVYPASGSTDTNPYPTLGVVAKDDFGHSLSYYFVITNDLTGAQQESGLFCGFTQPPDETLPCPSYWQVPDALEPGDYTWTVTVYDGQSAPVSRTSALHIAPPEVAP